MKLKSHLLSVGLACLAITAFNPSLSAQDNAGQGQGQGRRGGGGGNFDPAEMRQRMMERIREQMEVPKDDEWALISARLTKVMEARTAGGGFGFGGGRGPGGPGAPGGGGQGRGGGRGGRGPEAEALQQAIESKAAPDVLKAKMAAVREAQKATQAKLEKAQEELRTVLTVRQEAVALSMGLLR